MEKKYYPQATSVTVSNLDNPTSVTFHRDIAVFFHRSQNKNYSENKANHVSLGMNYAFPVSQQKTPTHKNTVKTHLKEP